MLLLINLCLLSAVGLFIIQTHPVHISDNSFLYYCRCIVDLKKKNNAQLHICMQFVTWQNLGLKYLKIQRNHAFCGQLWPSYINPCNGEYIVLLRGSWGCIRTGDSVKVLSLILSSGGVSDVRPMLMWAFHVFLSLAVGCCWCEVHLHHWDGHHSL